MAPTWALADDGDDVAYNLRVSCALFLRQANKEGFLPPSSQYPPDLGALTVYKCSVDRPFQGLDIIWTYTWYKAIPAWSSDYLWAVRVDHFIPHFHLPLYPALNDAVNGENGIKLQPVTFFTTKTLLPGGRYIYHRYVHNGGVIYPRSLLGFLDPLATADINATNPLLGHAYHFAPETQPSLAANGMLYSDVLLNATRYIPPTIHSHSTIHLHNSFVKGDHGTLEDPFNGPGCGPRSGRAGFGKTPGGSGNGNLNHGSPGIGPGRNMNQLAHLVASNAEPRKEKLLLKQLAEANRKFKKQEETMRAQSQELEALREKNLKKDASA